MTPEVRHRLSEAVVALVRAIPPGLGGRLRAVDLRIWQYDEGKAIGWEAEIVREDDHKHRPLTPAEAVAFMDGWAQEVNA